MLLSVFLPFLNFLVLALFGRLIGRSGAIISTLYLIGLTVILNCKVFYFLFIQKISIAFLLGT